MRNSSVQVCLARSLWKRLRTRCARNHGPTVRGNNKRLQPREFNCYVLIDVCLKTRSLAREVFYFSVFFKKWQQLRFLRTTFCLSSWKWLIPKFFDKKKLCRKTIEVTCNKMFFGLLSSHKYASNRLLTQILKRRKQEEDILHGTFENLQMVHVQTARELH